MPLVGERERSIDIQEDVDLGAAVLSATEQHGEGVIGGVQKDQLTADDQEAELAGDQSDEDDLDVEVDEEATEETDEVSRVSDEEDDDEEVGDADDIDEGEGGDEEDESDDLTPRDEAGRFDKRFTSIDPNKLPAELKPTYKSMQADYTRKGQELATMRGELEARMADYEEFTQELASEDGVIRLGVELAQRRPEAFGKMLDMVQRLSEDTPEAAREREYWQRDQQLRTRERQGRLAERQEDRRQRQELATRVTDMARQAAKKYGIPFSSVETYLDNAIAIYRQRSGGRISMQDVQGILDDYVAPYQEVAVRDQRKRARQQAKNRAGKKGKPRLPAGSPGSSTSRRQKGPEYKSLDDAIEKRIFGTDFDVG